jgi:NADH:ubiquinone oxidoreductase subunit 6 (subunit J)
VLVALGFFTWVLGRVSVATPATSPSPLGPVGTPNVFGSVGDFGTALFTTYLLPFEITALILMVAVIGVVLLAGDQTPYIATKKRAEDVRREMREAILREGGP